MNKINIGKLEEYLIKFIIIVSWPILNIYLNIFYDKKTIIISSIIIIIFLIFFLKKIKIKTIDKKYFWISLLISIYITNIFIDIIKTNLNTLISNNFYSSIFYLVIGTIILPSIIFIVYCVIINLKNYLKKIEKLSKVEKGYLIITIIIASVVSFAVVNNSTAFGSTKNYDYDIIYTSDSSYLTKIDVWSNIGCLENDIRQPFFGVFSLPFAIIAHLVSDLVFFIPKSYSYEFTMIITQYILIALSIIFLTRILKVKEKNKKYLYSLLTLNYPVILFGLLLEQYAISLFYLILTIYMFKINKKDEINNAYIAAVGTLSTSVVLFPLITKYDNFKNWFKKVFKCFKNTILVLILSGRLTLFFTLHKRLNFLLGFTGTTVSFYDKLCQYLNFIETLFLSNKGIITYDKNITSGLIYYSYQMDKTSSLNIVGIIILLICLISYILNRKEYMAKISFGWVFFSVIVLLFIGWGTAENGLILYSLYFYWAFYVLYYLLFKKLIKNDKIFNYIILISSILIFIKSIPTLYDLINFAIKYYPR